MALRASGMAQLASLSPPFRSVVINTVFQEQPLAEVIPYICGCRVGRYQWAQPEAIPGKLLPVGRLSYSLGLIYLQKSSQSSQTGLTASWEETGVMCRNTYSIQQVCVGVGSEVLVVVMLEEVPGCCCTGFHRYN